MVRKYRDTVVTMAVVANNRNPKLISIVAIVKKVKVSIGALDW